MRSVAAAALSLARACDIHDNRAHDVAGISKEMRAILDPQFPGIREAQIGLVNQRGRVEQSCAFTLAQPATGHATQVFIRGVEHQAQCRLVAPLGALDEIG